MSVALGHAIIVLAVCLQGGDAQVAGYNSQSTSCGQDVVISTNGGYDHINISLTLSLPQPSQLSCSWIIDPPNPTMSNQVLFSFPDDLSCDEHVFTVKEKDPVSQNLTPLILDCVQVAGRVQFKTAITQPGFSMLITLQASSPSVPSFTVFSILPVAWADVCPLNGEVIFLDPPEEGEDKASLIPTSGLISSLPHNMTCQWEIRSPDTGLVKLQLRTFQDTTYTVCGDYFTIANKEDATNPAFIRVCEGRQLLFDYTSTTGSAFITFQSAPSERAPKWFIKYWYVNPCPPVQPTLTAVREEVQALKGTSFSSQGAGQDGQCSWRITARRQVIKLTQMDAEDFEQSCNTNDYLMLNGRRVGMCDSSWFPIWSEGTSMDVAFHSRTEAVRRSFVLHYTAVFKTPCQGYPELVNITASQYIGQKVPLMPILQGDVSNGPTCQWLYSAEDEGKVIQVKVRWTDESQSDSNRGVEFDKHTCTFDNFHIYNGDKANSSAEIVPTCNSLRSYIIYTSISRNMLFVYTRNIAEVETGFFMDVVQVDPATSGTEVWIHGWSFLFLLLGLLLIQ